MKRYVSEEPGLGPDGQPYEPLVPSRSPQEIDPKTLEAARHLVGQQHDKSLDDTTAMALVERSDQLHSESHEIINDDTIAEQTAFDEISVSLTDPDSLGIHHQAAQKIRAERELLAGLAADMPDAIMDAEIADLIAGSTAPEADGK